MTRIPDRMLRDVCRAGTPECCRYVVPINNVYECQHHGQYRGQIDAQADAGQLRFTRVNCEGIIDCETVKEVNGP